MATLVLFHAHPDDEAIATGGTAARATAEGHRVVLVVATGGEYGQVPDDLADGETLADRRRVETERSAAALGIARVAWLGYCDSGMTGWEQNSANGAFTSAPLEEAAERLAAILRDERAEAMTTYDWHGVYGHPDHVKVHQVGRRAAELAGDVRVYQSTFNRTAMKEFMALAAGTGAMPDDGGFDPDGPADDGNPFGMPESDITTMVDVTAYVDRKRASISCHRSQVSDSDMFLSMPPEAFERAFGTEWFIHEGAAAGSETWLFG